MQRINYLFLLLVILISACSKNDGNDPLPDQSMYFPDNNNSWETQSISSLGWNTNALQDLKTFLAQKNTKSFMILINGRIVVEEYFDGHTASSSWPWNSAGKTLTTATIGIAQQEGLLNINNKVSDYLGNGWTSMPQAKEDLVTSKNLLSMNSGISDDKELVIKSNLTYLADAGTRWSYHNVFQKLMVVVESSSNQDFESYFDQKLKNKIGMDGFWNFGLVFNVYHSSTRSMARFGLLSLNKGKWKNEQIVNESFFNESITSSQSINPSYGYLWWLNGRSSYMIPQGQTTYTGTLIPNAPLDLYAAMGASDQRLYVVPGKKMVVIRMGEASDPANLNFAVSGFDNELWAKIGAVIN